MPVGYKAVDYDRLAKVIREELEGFELLPNGSRLLAHYGIGVPDRSGERGLNGPRDAFELEDGTWLITDMLNHRVIEVEPKTGEIIWQYGTTGKPGSGSNQLNNPYSAVRMPNGNTLIADRGNKRIIEVTPDKQIVWSLTGSDIGVSAIDPTSVQFTEEKTVVIGGGTAYPHVLEVSYPSKKVILDLTGNPAFSFPTYAHKIQSNEVKDTTDFYHYRHILVVDFNTGYFYNFNPDGTLVFATYRYSPFGYPFVGRGSLECVDIWSDRTALLTSPWVGAIIAYVKGERLDTLALLFGNKSPAAGGRAPPLICDTGYCHRTPDGNLLVSDYGSDMVYKVAPRLDKYVPPSPLRLWIGESIGTDGAATPSFTTTYVNKKTFYIYSDQAGTLYIQVYDEANLTFSDVDSVSVPAGKLTTYSTTIGARLMRLRFVPSATATVRAWAILE